MAKPATRLAFLQVVLGLGAAVVVVRAFTVQVEQHALWSVRAEARDVRTRAIAARRGSLYDRDGNTLAATYEAFHVSVSLNELRDTVAARQLIGKALDIPAAEMVRRFRRDHPYFDGPYDAAQVHPIRSLRGVHLDPLTGREHPMGELALPLLGRTDRNTDRGLEGIEAAFDSMLTGIPGKERVLLDSHGQVVPIPDGIVTPAVPGHDLVLSIDNGLQGIVESALQRAVFDEQAEGGDVVVLDVHHGEILALASLWTPPGSDTPVPGAGALVVPDEPGSTAKIFTAAALLRSHADTEPVLGEDGAWTMEVAVNRTRTIRDTHRETGRLGLGRAIQVSSNIAMSKFSLNLDANAQYRALRDFGFGTQPGTGFPGETQGFLPLPFTRANMRYTQPSWAMGYEFSASALQVAMGYAAIANGGFLLRPTLLREVREVPTGRVLWRHVADTVRRAIDSATARQLLDYLQLATDSGGTGEGAQLQRWRVLGKTGTAKLRDASGRYTTAYRGSFAGIVPGDDPRYVVYVAINRPGGHNYYGGLVAAPVVRTILLQALALPNSPLNMGGGSTTAPRAPRRPAPEPRDAPVRQVAFPMAGDTVQRRSMMDVPDVRGWTLREGIHQLQRRGLEVSLHGRGRIDRTDPAPGDSVVRGSTVTVYATAQP